MGIYLIVALHETGNRHDRYAMGVYHTAEKN